MTISKSNEMVTLICTNCGCRVYQVGLGWVHLDNTTRCLRQPTDRWTAVATPTVWVTTDAGEPF